MKRTKFKRKVDPELVHKFLCNWRLKFISESISDFTEDQRIKLHRIKRRFERDGKLESEQLDYLRILCYGK